MPKRNFLRALTDKEDAAMTATGELQRAYARLPVVHPSDADDFVHHLHAIQNIILARPATEYLQVERLRELGVQPDA